MTDFYDLLEHSEFIFLDGGMGTMLQSMGIESHIPETLNITNPQAIMSIHRQYIEAGADIIYANTFGANALKLADSGYTVAEIVGTGIENAHKSGKIGRAHV